MFESFKKITTSNQIKEALLAIVATRVTDFFPDTNGQSPTEEHFAQYTSMVEANYKTLKSYTDQHGWPSKEKLTKMGLSQEDALAVETSAFLCIQHLDTNITPRIKAKHYDITGQELASTWQDKLGNDRVVERQREMLELMEKDGANRGFCCYLTDRVLRNSNQPQLFGTQGSLSNFGIGEEKPPQISLPNGEIVSIDVAITNDDFLAIRNSSGLLNDGDSLGEYGNPLSFIAEVRDHFPPNATDPRLNTLKAEIASVRETSPLHEPYNKGLDPTTVEFTSYINGSKDWANIGKEIKYFQNLLESPKEHERVDAKGYVLTCMFKILSAIDEFDNERTNSDGTLKRETDPREKIDQETREFLGGDLSLETLKAKTTQYSNEIIRQHGEENTAPALSSVASSYGVRAYMQHLELATEEEMRPEVEPKKYYQDIDLPMPDNMKKNIALAMEKFEESAELGNVRSMGSVVTWAEKCNHPRLHDLNEKWTTIAATAPIPNPNSQIDYAEMLKDKGDLEGARDMYQRAADFGLIKAHQKLEAFQKEQSELASKMAEDKTEPKSFVEKLGLSEKEKPSSFVERMRSDKTNGKSQGGSMEL